MDNHHGVSNDSLLSVENWEQKRDLSFMMERYPRVACMCELTPHVSRVGNVSPPWIIDFFKKKNMLESIQNVLIGK